MLLLLLRGLLLVWKVSLLLMAGEEVLLRHLRNHQRGC